MAEFIVRIQLNNIDKGDDSLYDLLHEKMKDEKFKQYYPVAKENIKYDLPHAEYYTENDKIKDVLSSAIKASDEAIKEAIIKLNESGKKNENLYASILVIEANNIINVGLNSSKLTLMDKMSL